MDSLPDARIGSAATQVTIHGHVDVLIGWIGMFGEQGRGRHDLASLAVSALWHVDFHPGLLQWMLSIRRQSFDCRDLFSVYLRNRRDARAFNSSIDVNGARATHRHAASVLCAGQIEYFTNHPKQRHVGRHVDRYGLSIYG